MTTQREGPNEGHHYQYVGPYRIEKTLGKGQTGKSEISSERGCICPHVMRRLPPSPFLHMVRLYCSINVCLVDSDTFKLNGESTEINSHFGTFIEKMPDSNYISFIIILTDKKPLFLSKLMHFFFLSTYSIFIFCLFVFTFIEAKTNGILI